jgi:hypothetical protein
MKLLCCQPMLDRFSRFAYVAVVRAAFSLLE